MPTALYVDRQQFKSITPKVGRPRETTFEIVQNVSNIVLAFAEHCFSITYKGPKIALSGVAEMCDLCHLPYCGTG